MKSKIVKSLKIFLIFLLNCSLFKSKNEYCTENPGEVWGRYNYDTPTVSPDGDLIAFSYGGNPYGTDTVGMFLYRISTNKFYKLLAGLPPMLISFKHFSPDGKWIVFSKYAQIWKMKINGDSLTQLTFSGWNLNPRWSPDGKKIIYHRTSPAESSGIWLMNADGTCKRKIINGSNADWYPLDMKKIIYTDLDGNLYICDTSAQNKKKILDLSSIGAIYKILSPRFSPDGSKIVFAAQRPRESIMIWVMNSDGSEPVPLAVGDEPDWFPDGSKIIYTNTRYGEVWVMDANGCNKTPLIGDFNFKGGQQ